MQQTGAQISTPIKVMHGGDISTKRIVAIMHRFRALMQRAI